MPPRKSFIVARLHRVCDPQIERFAEASREMKHPRTRRPDIIIDGKCKVVDVVATGAVQEDEEQEEVLDIQDRETRPWTMFQTGFWVTDDPPPPIPGDQCLASSLYWYSGWIGERGGDWKVFHREKEESDPEDEQAMIQDELRMWDDLRGSICNTPFDDDDKERPKSLYKKSPLSRPSPQHQQCMLSCFWNDRFDESFEFIEPDPLCDCLA